MEYIVLCTVYVLLNKGDPGEIESIFYSEVSFT